MSLALCEQRIFFAHPTIEGWKEDMEIRKEENIGDCIISLAPLAYFLKDNIKDL